MGNRRRIRVEFADKNVLNLHTHPSLIKARERENILCLLLSGSRVHSINTALAELNDSA